MHIAESGESITVKFNPPELRVIRGFWSFLISSLRIQCCTTLTNLLTVQAQPCKTQKGGCRSNLRPYLKAPIAESKLASGSKLIVACEFLLLLMLLWH